MKRPVTVLAAVAITVAMFSGTASAGGDNPKRGTGWHGWMGRGRMLSGMGHEGMQIFKKHGHTGECSDGRVFVMPVESAADIRTGQGGDAAL